MAPLNAATDTGVAAVVETVVVDTELLDTAPEGMWVQVGTGWDAVQLLGEGDPLTMVHGPQGGWHVDTAGVVHMCGPDVYVTPSLEVVSTQQLLTPDDRPIGIALVGYDPLTAVGEFYGVRAMMNPPGLSQADVCALGGEAAVLCLDVEDISTLDHAGRCVEVTLELDERDATLCPLI